MRIMLLLVLVLAGCGYRAVGPGGERREGIASVAVPVVANGTDSRDLGDPLTAALVREIESRTPYRVADAARADTLLEVTIVAADFDTFDRDRRTGLPNRRSLRLVADFAWTDLRTGRELLAVDGFAQTAAQYPTLGEGEFVAEQQAAEELARGIVDELAARW